MKLSDNLKILTVLYYHNRSTIQETEQQSNTTQVIESDLSNCNFRDALIARVIGLFHGIHLFYPTNLESLAAFRLSGRPILCELNRYV